MRMHREDVATLLLELDRIEAHLRQHEHALYRIRHRLAEAAGLLPGEFGFIEEAPVAQGEGR